MKVVVFGYHAIIRLWFRTLLAAALCAGASCGLILSDRRIL